MSTIRSARTGATSRFFTQRVRPQVPQAMTDAAAAQRAAHPNPTTIGGRTMNLGGTSKAFLPAGSVASLQTQLGRLRDAGNARIGSSNGNLHVLSYSYHTGKPMEAWLQDPPRNGKLKLQVVATPSWHVGSSSEQKKKNGENFALTNTYIAEVRYPDGKRERKEFKVNGSKPEYASVSPEFEIDLEKYKGQDVRISGWAKGSAGVAGYSEKRETILHIPG